MARLSDSRQASSTETPPAERTAPTKRMYICMYVRTYVQYVCMYVRMYVQYVYMYMYVCIVLSSMYV